MLHIINQEKMVSTQFQHGMRRQAWQPGSLQAEAVALPAEMYTSAEIYRREQAQIFGKFWCYVGHASQLDGPGSYFTVEVAEQPLVILQDRQGQLRAFFNVCTHRAGPLAIGSGKCNRLTCLYHAWSFDLAGNLRGVPDMEAAENFDLAAHALQPLQVDTWGPFIFVNLEQNCQPLHQQLGELPELFKRYQFSNWARVHSIDYWVDINWKLYVENNAESYHEPIVHPSLAKYYQRIQVEARHYYYLQRSPISLDDNQALTRDDPELYAPGLSQEEMEWASIMSFFPNFAWILTPACAIIYLIDPQGVQKTRVRWDWLVPNTEAAKSPANLEPLIAVFDHIQQEDLRILPEVQKRIRSLGYTQGRLSPTREVGTHLFQNFVMQAIA